ncbi:MAG: S-layer homology domain-containing protein [Clostridia bacterium]|nr:S-layer homology domain-containing protein [Clostridia bacterium]
MKRFMKKFIGFLVAFIMTFEVGDVLIAQAAYAMNDAINPTWDSTLVVPEKYRDGGNWFFIAQPDWWASENDSEPMYIPIQRTGDLDSEADITLKVIDLTAKHDVNYKAEIFRENTEAQVEYADMSVKDLALNEDNEYTEVETTDENGMGAAINEMGGADILDGSGTVIGSVTATPLDENGNPIVEDAEAEEGEEVPEEQAAELIEDETAEATAQDGKKSPTDRLRAARSAYTGKASDRQELEGGDLKDLAEQVGGNTMSDDEFDQEMADATQDGYPGLLYVLHFEAGEEAKYLKVTPLYSDAAEGDAQIMLMLKSPSENFGIGEDTNPVNITIFDEDEPEPVTVSLASELVMAEDGKAKITVTREGRLNAIKGVTVSSWDGTAKQGDEYSGIGAKLYFPMGIKSRTIEIPVYHGTEEKDFNITITPLDDEIIETATARVVIPAATTQSDGELMGVSDYQGQPFTEPINIKAGSGGNGFGFDGDTGFHMSTRIDKEETTHFWLPTSGSGYAYDGMYVHYNGFLNWCDGEFRLSRWNPGGTNIQYNDFDDGGKHDDHWLFGYWGDKKAPEKISIEVANVDNEGAVWDDSYAAMWVDEVRFIKRKFNIYVEPAEVKPLIGMTDEQVLNDYEAVMLDNSTYSHRSLWSEDSFALTAKDTKSPLRLVGIEAKVRDNTKEAWYRIATIDGKSDTAVVKMTQDRINAMAAKGCIQWDKNGSGNGGDSWQGTITVRPVFDYINTTVEIKNEAFGYGALNLPSPTPSMLWDFNSDRKMDDVMGVDSFYATRRVTWTGEKQGDDDYYTFTATGGDPFVPVITHAESLDNIRYIKVRAKNLNRADKMQLYASINGGGLTENAHIDIPLEKDTGWHEYVIDIKNSPGYVDGGWNGRISYIRFDPMDGNAASGSKIQVDYMAFFPDENSAKAYRNGTGVYEAGTYTYHLNDKIDFKTEMKAAGLLANMEPDGFYYELRKSNQNGELINFNDIHYINGGLPFQLTDKALSSDTVDHPYYSFKPIFTEKGNRITVMVPDTYYDNYLDTTTGIFAEGDEYYTFTASSEDPMVSIDMSANADDIQWAKFRVRNVGGAEGLQIFTGSGASSVSASTGAWMLLSQDKYWREYVVNLKELNKQTTHAEDTTWKGNIEWFRLDPMDGNTKNGTQIQIDYMAFFPDEASAKAYKNNGKGSPSMLWDFNKSGAPAMGGHCKANVSFAGAKEGGQSYISVTHKDGAYYYVIAEDILTNDIYELDAYTKNPDRVIPKWTLSDGSEYFGNAMYIRSNPRPKDNAITLTAASGSHLTYATLSGTIVSSTMNLASGRSATDLNSANGAVVSFGVTGAVTNEDGKFTTPAFLYDSEAKIRYLVSYNGVTTIQEAKVPSNRAAKTSEMSVSGKQVQAVNADAGMVRVDTYSETGAHFVSAIASQRGQLQGALHGLTLNGNELRVLVKVDKGGEYTVGNKTYTENIKDVTLYFMDQETGEIHGRFSSNTEPATGGPAKWSYDDETGEFWLVINSFDPAHPTEWTYGDVLMAQLTTDKITAMGGMGDDNAAVKDMVYDAVSTGYGVYADPNYSPLVLDYKVEDVASELGVLPKTDEDGDLLGDDDDTRYSFGAFPYIGQISAAVGVVSKVVATVTKSEDAEAMLEDLKNAPDPASLTGTGVDENGNEIEIDPTEDDFDEAAGDTGNDAGQKSTSYTFLFSLFFEVQETSYGGVRFMLGVIAAVGGGKGYSRQKNPFHNKGSFLKRFKQPVSTDTYTIGAGGSSLNEKTGELTKVGGNVIENDLIHGNNKYMGTSGQGYSVSDYGGPYFKITAYIGVYLDYGYIEISKNGGAEKSHDMVYMGAGGFIGFSGTVGYTWAFMLVVIPAYVNVEAGIGVTFFLGSSANPNKTLESFKNSKELKGQDFGFTFEIKGNAYVSGTIGVGLYKIIGIRVTVGLGFELAYSPKMSDWYPGKFDSDFGYVSEISFTGTIDLFITSIDIYSASWPLPLADGFLYYFQEVRRANLTISYVENAMKNTEASESEKATARAMIKELSELIDSDKSNTETIKEKAKALKNYAYDHDMLSWVAKCRIEMNKQGGIVGSIVNAALQDDTDESGIAFHTNDHVDSKWVANDGELTAAFSAVESTPLVKNAISQPSSKIVNIGDGKFLMTFLDDTTSRDKQQASTLKWSVYDGSKWSEPVTVQDDNTADGKPNLVDAGDKVILSWSSITDEKYNDLKEAVRAELTDAGLSDTDTDVQEMLEKDPARVLAQMDIFTAEFDKAAGEFGEITQLTDDEFYDDNPQAVYDAETKDYIVLYYKTAQDDEDYTTAGDKLLDVVGASADPEKSYSVIAYMLYNGQQEDGDPYDIGWVTEGLYDNEVPENYTSDSYIAEYGPERYLPSAIIYDNGEYADPPIYDLTTAPGYNGLAAYAFTVDKDYNLKTAEDRELYTQFYDFASHSTYVPVRVAGDVTYEAEKYNSETEQFETRQYTDQVEVGAPKLIRNGGNTYLFWRENGQNLKYLNISQMLNAKVAAVAEPGENPADWQYALGDDGTFNTDASTGITYAPNAKYVDFGSLMTSANIEITDYEVISDDNDNLYVVWTDAVTHDVTDEVGITYPVVSQPIYASAMIHQDEREIAYTNEETGEEQTRKESTVSWSKPYRLTRDDNFNDGLALALDDDGNLMIVHNQYEKKNAEDEAELMQLVKDGKIGLAYDKEGNAYAPTLSYNSPVNLMVTKCEKIGSLEATRFEYSDYNPAPGETVTVRATLENVGLTDAEGSKVEFYEYKDGALGEKIYSFTSDDHIQVNTAKAVNFKWTVPEEGADGYQIAAVVQERNSSGGYYPAVTSYSDAFTEEAQLVLKVNSVTQEGDKFRVDYSVINAGNAPVPEGYKVGLNLVGLYGDLDSDQYGNIENGQLYSTDLVLDSKWAEPNTKLISTDDGVVERKASTIHTTEFNESVLVDIPVSVFKFCGYDALQLVVEDEKGNVSQESDQAFVSLASPMNLSLNGGEAVSLMGDETKQVEATFDSTVFMGENKVIYSVEDPSIASVSEDGTVTGIKNGTTTVTATLLPSGQSETVDLTVSGITYDSYIVSFDANGGSGEMEDMEVEAETKTALTDNAFTRKGYKFTGWNTKSDGSGTSYKNGQEITLEDDIRLYAQWKKNSSSSGGGGGGTASAETYSVSAGETENGTAKLSSEKAKAGDTVTITVTPDEGYEVDTVTVKDANGNEIPVTRLGAKTFTYKQPASEVTVDITFKEAGDEPYTSKGKFIDVNEGDWFYDAVYEAVDDGIVYGMTENTYEPQLELTRAMFAAMLHRYDGSEASEYEFTFEDIPEDAWYVDDIRWAAEHGIIKGYDDKTFGPDDKITREQAVAMMQRYTAYKGIDTAVEDGSVLEAYSDKDTISSYAVEPITWALSAGVIKGRSEDTLAPLDNITRAEIAQVFVNYKNNIKTDIEDAE